MKGYYEGHGFTDAIEGDSLKRYELEIVKSDTEKQSRKAGTAFFTLIFVSGSLCGY
jgi:hypothetical protein